MQGEPDQLNFVAYYTSTSPLFLQGEELIGVEGEEVVAVASMQRDPVVARVSELFALGRMLTASEVRAGKVGLCRAKKEGG